MPVTVDFLHRGEDGHVGRRRELGDVVAVAEELDGAGEAGRGQLALVALAERPFAHELQHRVVAAAKDPEGAEEHRVVLHGLEPCHAEERRALVLHHPCARPELAEVDAVADVADAAPGADAEAADLLDLLAVLAEQQVAEAGEPALRGHPGEAPQRAHVLVEVEAVRRVDHQRHAREPRGDPADRAGDRVVRVDDGVALGPHERDEAAEEPSEARGRHVARDVEGRHPRLLDVEAREVWTRAAHDVVHELAVPVDPPHAVREEVQRRVVGVDDVEDAGPRLHAFSLAGGGRISSALRAAGPW